ncbi:MAG: MazG family protein [Verrucomicrobia bacterium]|jgi:NTP pyrophosphatase (non-canonical NTP hydrolase)|nr:MazG family protein [Verrucomicrobiota bacterium]
MKKPSAIHDLLNVMARLRSPKGCPWDREQSHHSLRWHAVEEVYELIDAIEAGDDHELEEELGDLLLQVVFHCQLARERGAFDFERVARHITDKLIRRHPHVFGNLQVKDVDEVWANWEKIKRAEKHGTHRARPSVLDGIPKHLPALQRAEKLTKKARKANLLADGPATGATTRSHVARQLLALARYAQSKGWSAEDLLRRETQRFERRLRQAERRAQRSSERNPAQPAHGAPAARPRGRSPHR